MPALIAFKLSADAEEILDSFFMGVRARVVAGRALGQRNDNTGGAVHWSDAVAARPAFGRHHGVDALGGYHLHSTGRNSLSVVLGLLVGLEFAKASGVTTHFLRRYINCFQRGPCG